MEAWTVYPATKLDSGRFGFLFYKDIGQAPYIFANLFVSIKNRQIGFFSIFLSKILLNYPSRFACQPNTRVHQAKCNILPATKALKIWIKFFFD